MTDLKEEPAVGQPAISVTALTIDDTAAISADNAHLYETGRLRRRFSNEMDDEAKDSRPRLTLSESPVYDPSLSRRFRTWDPSRDHTLLPQSKFDYMLRNSRYICRRWKRDRECPFGRECRWLHMSDEGYIFDTGLLNSGLSYQLREYERPQAHRARARARRAKQVRARTLIKGGEHGTNFECLFFRKFGWCTKSARCDFQHITPEGVVVKTNFTSVTEFLKSRERARDIKFPSPAQTQIEAEAEVEVKAEQDEKKEDDEEKEVRLRRGGLPYEPPIPDDDEVKIEWQDIGNGQIQYPPLFLFDATYSEGAFFRVLQRLRVKAFRKIYLRRMNDYSVQELLSTVFDNSNGNSNGNDDDKEDYKDERDDDDDDQSLIVNTDQDSKSLEP